MVIFGTTSEAHFTKTAGIPSDNIHGAKLVQRHLDFQISVVHFV